MANIICTVCPNGCRMQARFEDGILVADGNGCKKGREFAKNELINPMRSLTTTVRTAFYLHPALPVRTDGEIPKAKIPEAMVKLAEIVVAHSVKCGDIVLSNILGTGCDIIATAPLFIE